MPSTYTTNLGIEKIGTGEQSGTWGDTTNTNFDLIDQAINGIGSKTVSSTDTANPTQIQITDGSISDGRDAFIEFTSSADLGAAGAVQLTPNDAEKIVHVRNSLQGSQSLIIFQGAYNASNDYVVPNGADVLLKFSGTGSGSTVTPVQLSPKFDGTMRVEDVVVSGTGSVDFSTPNAQIILRNDQISGNVINGGTISNFASTGIDDNATQTTLTIDSNEVAYFSTGTVGASNTETIINRWATSSDVDNLLPGSSSGPIIEGGWQSHLVLGIRDNDTNDGLYIVSGNGNYSTDSTYDKVVASFKSDGTSEINGSFTVNGNIVVTGTVDGRDIAADGAKLDGIAPGAQVNVGTNLSATADGTQLQVNSSTGNNVDLPAATTSAWGVMTDEDKTKLDGIAPSANNYSLPKATATVRGGVELGSNTVQTVAANTVSSTAARTYAVQLNSADQMVVNVPWSDSSNPGTVTSIATGTGIAGGTITTSGTISLDFAELTDMTADISGSTEFILQNGTTESRKAASEIKLSNFNNDAGWTSNTGDITNVDAGNGLTGGGGAGSVTLNVGAGTGISVAADTVGLATAGAGAGTYGSTSNGTKIDQITLDAYGRVTAITTGATGTATVNDTGVPALLGTGGNVTLNTGITQVEVRNAIGAGTSSTTGTVTSVAGANGISGTVTTSGSLTLDSDLRGHVTTIGVDTNDFYSIQGTQHNWVLDGTEDMRLTNNGQLDVEGNVVAFSTTVSDQRLKDNVETIANPLDTVSALRGVTFEWNKGHRKGQKDIGVIAQEVQAVLPELIVEAKNSLIDGEDYLTVSYGQMAGLFIECFKEVISRLEALENK